MTRQQPSQQDSSQQDSSQQDSSAEVQQPSSRSTCDENCLCTKCTTPLHRRAYYTPYGAPGDKAPKKAPAGTSGASASAAAATDDQPGGAGATASEEGATLSAEGAMPASRESVVSVKSAVRAQDLEVWHRIRVLWRRNG